MMPTMPATSFEDLHVWKRSKELCVQIYKVSRRGAFARDFGLRDQIQRASVSVMSNIAEGFERFGGVEFKRFLAIARGSAGEVRSQLYLAKDLGYVDEIEFERLRAECIEITRMLTALRNSVNR